MRTAAFVSGANDIQDNLLPDTQGNRNGMCAHIQLLTATGGDHAEREWKRLSGPAPPWLSADWARPDSHGYSGRECRLSYAVYPLCLSAQAALRELRDEGSPC